MPLAAPGRIPAYLPAFAADNADVARLKDNYNAAIGQLHASAQAISTAVAGRSADAQAAAQMIRTAIGGDGLNNPSGFLHWVEHAADDVGHAIASHWAGFVAGLANAAGVIASACGIIALVLAFIPGLQAFAAAFETVALLAQAVAFACHAVLLAAGHGSWLDPVHRHGRAGHLRHRQGPDRRGRGHRRGLRSRGIVLPGGGGR